MDSDTKVQTKQCIYRIEKILGSNVFDSRNAQHPLRESAFIELMICIRDLLHKAEKYAKRIDFADDVLTNDYVNDVTDAITATRDACCHIDSFKRRFSVDGGYGAFNSIHGKGSLVKSGTIDLASDYDDDVAFFYGSNRIYMKRHVIRAFEQAKTLLNEYLS